MDKMTIEYEPYPLRVWAISQDAARAFFGLPADTLAIVLKDEPETPDERAKYRPNAKLYAFDMAR